MKVAAITGIRTCEIAERPEPTIADDYVRIKILSAPMCTEVADYHAGRTSDCLGHEAAGEVLETARPGRFKLGDRVVVMPQNSCGQCDYCLSGEHIHCGMPRDPYLICGTTTGRATYAEQCIQQEWLLLPVPDDLSTDHASMACCGLGPSLNAASMMGMTGTDTVLISGLGAVGLGAVINAKVRGARVIGIESHPRRIELAKTLGAYAVVNPMDPDALQQVLALTNGRGADMSIEASSAESAPDFLAKATRPKGQVAIVGWGGQIMARDIVSKGLTVRGAWHWNHLRDANMMWETIRRAGSLLDLFITHIFPLSKVQDAWELQATGQAGKIIIHPYD